ncbi:MAG: DNA repair protein RecN [Paludibacteraceae bacterium]
MLKSLHISNYALINELDIRFDNGMTVLTGETGAGKSIIIGALSLVMGQRADSRIIKEGEQKTVVEVGFNVKNYDLQAFFKENELDYSDTTIIRREVAVNGKSRAFINDTPVQLNLLKELSNKLIDIHSQHENLLLATENYQLQVIDTVAENESFREVYRQAFEDWAEAKANLHKLKKEAERQSDDLDYLEFQLAQLDEAKLVENEMEELETEQETLSHVEEIKSELQRTENQLESEEANVISAVKESRNAIQRINPYLSEADQWVERLEGILIELKDITAEIAYSQQKIEFDPERLEFIDSRLSTIYALQKKFKVENVSELIALRESYRLQLDRIGNMDDELLEAAKQVERCAAKLEIEATKLTDSRKKVAPFIESHLVEKLSHLGMPDIRFQISITPSEEVTQTGQDTVTFLFSANKNRSVQPVAEIASGGEISRVMLAIKSMLVVKADLPTIIFDEIDSGVSGDIAGRMGEIMKLMSDNSQVIVITHLPQIASKGKNHFKVYKDATDRETLTYIKQLSSDERVREIAQMLSGKEITEAALMNAKELMK